MSTSDMVTYKVSGTVRHYDQAPIEGSHAMIGYMLISNKLSTELSNIGPMSGSDKIHVIELFGLLVDNENSNYDKIKGARGYLYAGPTSSWWLVLQGTFNGQTWECSWEWENSSPGHFDMNLLDRYSFKGSSGAVSPSKIWPDNVELIRDVEVSADHAPATPTGVRIKLLD